MSAADELIDSLLVTGFHYGIQRDPEELVSLFREFITRSRAVRRLGSAALDLCYVAAGRFDGYWESKIQPWDVAAGAPDCRGGRRARQHDRGRALPIARRQRAREQRT